MATYFELCRFSETTRLAVCPDKLRYCLLANSILGYSADQDLSTAFWQMSTLVYGHLWTEVSTAWVVCAKVRFSRERVAVVVLGSEMSSLRRLAAYKAMKNTVSDQSDCDVTDEGLTYEQALCAEGLSDSSGSEGETLPAVETVLQRRPTKNRRRQPSAAESTNAPDSGLRQENVASSSDSANGNGVACPRRKTPTEAPLLSPSPSILLYPFPSLLIPSSFRPCSAPPLGARGTAPWSPRG